MICVDAIIVAGGLGKRFETSRELESSLPKQFQTLGQHPVFIHAIKSLFQIAQIQKICLVIPESHKALAQKKMEQHLSVELRNRILVCDGGTERQDSCWKGLQMLAKQETKPHRVLIHDACRPYLPPKMLSMISQKIEDRSYAAWIPVISLVDTLKKTENQEVIETLPRTALVRVQTPQIFEFEVIYQLNIQVQNQEDKNIFTDDASLCEYFGIPVGVFEGDPRSFKLTYDFEKPALLSLLEAPKKGSQCELELDTTFTA